MATYRYRARSQRGDMVTGLVEASSADAVAGQLLNSGISNDFFFSIDGTVIRVKLEKRLISQ